jgi:hypothetical protein
MDKFKNLFQIFGVPRRATDELVKRRWFEHVEASHGEDQVPARIRYAYRVLRKAGLRNQYGDLLDACRAKRPLFIKPFSVQGLKDFCKSVEISVSEDPGKGNWFHFRLPNQAPFQMPTPPRRTFLNLRQAMVEVVTLKVFRGKSAAARFYLALTYLLALCTSAVSARWTIGVVRQELARHLESDVLSLHASVSDEYRDLQTARSELIAAFQRQTATTFDDSNPSHRPHELDMAMIRHPSVRAAWVNLREASSDAERVRQVPNELIAVDSRMRVGTFLVSDRRRLRELLDTIRIEREKIEREQAWVKHIGRMIAQDEFEYSSTQFAQGD